MVSEAKQAAQPEESSGYSHAWRALRHRNFRLYVFGQSISMMGTWMTRIAMAWLVYRLTKSPWMLGAIGFSNQLPMFLLAPVAGVIVDRTDRHKLLTVTQIFLMCHSLLLATLTLTHIITIPILFVLSVCQGLINTLDFPARQTFMMRMVGDRHDIQNAIAINASITNSARLIGPSLAGLLIAATSEGWCFLTDGISYAAVITSLLMMRLTPENREPSGATVVSQIREGWTYVSNSIPIRSMLLLLAVICIMGWPFTVLMPIFAAQVLHGGANTMGFLYSALGLGALTSAITMAMRRSVRGLAGQFPMVEILFGSALICFGLSHWLWLSLALLACCGYGLLRGNNAVNTIMQTIVEEKMRGRVMSYFTFCLEGLTPWGSLIFGAMAHKLGAPRTVMFAGTVCIAASVWFWMNIGRVREAIRPIYEDLGIRPRILVPDAADE
jgi:MFS family permease